MDHWIELARGPLFRIALTACLLGLAYRVLVVVAIVDMTLAVDLVWSIGTMMLAAAVAVAVSPIAA